MKKIGIFCAALLALGFTACDDTSDLGKMQVNEQQPVMEANGVGISYLGGFNDGTLDLTASEGKELPLLSWNITDPNFSLPESFKPFFRLRVASNGLFEDQITLDLSASETEANEILISADALNNAVITLFGRQPVERNMWIAVESYMVDGTQLTVLSRDLGKKAVKVTPVNGAEYADIEANYYLMTSLDGMTVDKAVKMNHSDKHQYDDPTFNYVINVTEDDLTAMGGKLLWKVVPESAYNANANDGLFGVADDTTSDTLSGELILGGKAGELTAASKYMFVLDMLKKTYEIRYAADELYVWVAKGAFNKACLLTTDDNVHFSGAAILLANWKLAAQKNFNGLQFGTKAGLEEGHLIAGNSAAPIKPESIGLSWMDVDLAKLTYSVQYVETLGVVGNMTSWGGDPDIKMTPNADFNVWTAIVTFPEEGDFKIRSNGSWDGLNFGGDMDNLNYGGDNLKCEPGTYDLTLTIGYDHVYTLKMVKK